MKSSMFARKFAALFLAVVLSFAFALPGCSSSSNGTSDSEGAEYSQQNEEQSGQAQGEELYFRSSKLMNEHYNKHGREMGFASAEEYEQAASDVANNPSALHKTEAEDGDDVYYLESSNDFVVVSTDGYIRTYFRPDDGKAYFDRQ